MGAAAIAGVRAVSVCGQQLSRKFPGATGKLGAEKPDAVRAMREIATPEHIEGVKAERAAVGPIVAAFRTFGDYGRRMPG